MFCRMCHPAALNIRICDPQHIPFGIQNIITPQTDSSGVLFHKIKVLKQLKSNAFSELRSQVVKEKFPLAQRKKSNAFSELRSQVVKEKFPLAQRKKSNAFLFRPLNLNILCFSRYCSLVAAMLRNSRANVLPDVPSGSIEYKDL